MIKPIMKDPLFLGQNSIEADKSDLQVVQDLIDTLNAHKDACVGMAANMIGVKKQIIVVQTGFFILAMINPEIVNKSTPYRAEEGCLSLTGVRKTTRYKEIEVTYLDKDFKKQQGMFEGQTAQIIQHEIDHCNGIII